MSRSHRAWTESCALVRAAVRGAGKLGKPDGQGRLGYERLLGTVPSLTRRSWLAAAVVLLVSALAPAVSLGKVGSSPHRKPPAAHAPQGSSKAHDARSAKRPSARRLRPGAFAGVQSLALGSGYESGHSAGAVRVLQRRLTRAGYAPGPIDGRYGPLTERAVVRFQAATGLGVDGIAGPQTLATLASAKFVLYPGSGYVPGSAGPVRVLQRRLTRAGYVPGPIDGHYGPRTERAVMRFQAANGLRVDGIAGPKTFDHLPVQGSSRRQVHRHPRPARPRPGSKQSRPASAQAPTAHRARHAAGSSSIAWLVLLGGLLVLALLASVSWRACARRSGRLGTDPGGEASSAFNQGVLLEQSGDLAGATAAYQRADQRGHASAACNLGVLLEVQGELAGAESAYRRADQRGDASGAFNLGVLLEQSGDLAGATAAYQRADRRGESAAACNLGVLLEEQGELTGAESAFRRADQRGDAGGAFNLGVLLEQTGDLTGAVAALRRAGERGSPEVAQRAHAVLVGLDSGNDGPTADQNGGAHNGR
jgi:peptidoglycan hydrolase-like protein with peptidoglycan-binding domain/Flp pilus assembly protein TadD